MTPSIILECDIHLMDDVSDLSSCGSIDDRSKEIARQSRASRKNCPRKTNRRRRSRQSLHLSDEDDGIEGDQPQLRRVASTGNPLSSIMTGNVSPIVLSRPALQRASTDGTGISRTTLAPRSPRRRSSISKTEASTTEQDDETFPPLVQIRKMNQCTASITALPACPHSSMDALPTKPVTSLCPMVTRKAASAVGMSRHRSMDSLPSRPTRRASIIEEDQHRPQANAVW